MKKTTIIAVFAFVASVFTACTTGTNDTNAASTDTTVVTKDSTKADSLFGTPTDTTTVVK